MPSASDLHKMREEFFLSANSHNLMEFIIYVESEFEFELEDGAVAISRAIHSMIGRSFVKASAQQLLLKINVMKEDLPCHKTKLDSNVLRRLRVRTGMWPGTRVAEGSHIMKLNTGEDPAGFFWCVQTQEEVRDIQNFAATFKQSTYVFSSPAKLAVYSDNFNESEKTLVESLASYYVEEIQLVHPRGPISWLEPALVLKQSMKSRDNSAHVDLRSSFCCLSSLFMHLKCAVGFMLFGDGFF